MTKATQHTRTNNSLSRRGFVAGGLTLAAAVPLSGCVSQLFGANDSSVSSVSSGSQYSEYTSAANSTDDLAYAMHIDKSKIMTVEISADETAWQEMLDNATAEEYISANISINGASLENIGIRPKGNSSLSSIASDETTDRYSFKVDFGEYVDEQTWYGLDKLVLNANWADASSMKEYLSYDLLNQSGVDTPLFAYANIFVNGANWGFYLLIEVLDKAYRRRVKNDTGELYKPESTQMGGGMQMPEDGTMPEMPEGITLPEDGQMPEGLTPPTDGTMPDGMTLPEDGTMPEIPEGMGNVGDGGGMGGMGASGGVSLVYTDDEESSYSAIFDNAETNTNSEDHVRVIEAIKNLNAGTELKKYVDVDACLRYFAAHNIVVSLDSYTGSMGHNYYLYENDGRIAILPWDYNMSFGGFQSGDASSVVNFPIDTPVSGTTMSDRPLIGKLFEVEDYLTSYHDYVRQLIDHYFTGEQFAAKVDELDALIGEHIKSDPSAFYTYDEYATAIGELKKLGTLREQSVIGQLDGNIPTTTDGQTAAADKLVDASDLDMAALGNMGGAGGMGGGGGMRGQMPEGMQMPDGTQAPSGNSDAESDSSTSNSQDSDTTVTA